MSKGYIKDYRISIKPSSNLITFICSLSNQKSLPENFVKIHKCYSNDNSNESDTLVTIDKIAPIHYTKEETNILKDLSNNICNTNDLDVIEAFKQLLITADKFDEHNSDYDSDDEDDIENLDNVPKSKNQIKREKEQLKQKERSKLAVNLNDLKWLNAYLIEKRSIDQNCHVYLHELLSDSKLILPKNEIVERNPELEARCVKLRLQQDAKRYRDMTKNVDSTKKYMPEDTIAYQMNQINRQLIAVLQFVFSVAAGFAFGFIGVELIIGNLDFGFRLLLGIMCSLIIALAEIYFLAKKLNEEYDESVQQPKVLLPAGNTNNTNKQHLD